MVARPVRRRSGRHCSRWKAAGIDVALAVGVEQMARGLIEMPGRPTGFTEEGAIGTITTPSMFAQAGLMHSARCGTTFEQFAAGRGQEPPSRDPQRQGSMCAARPRWKRSWHRR